MMESIRKLSIPQTEGFKKMSMNANVQIKFQIKIPVMHTLFKLAFHKKQQLKCWDFENRIISMGNS